MNAVKLTDVQYRMALYYRNKLRVAASVYTFGHEHSEHALRLLDQDWPHIKQWRDWSAEHVHEDERIAELCKDYPLIGQRLFLLRQNSQERIDWLEIGLTASQHLGDLRSQMVLLLLLAVSNNQTSSFSKAQVYAEQALTMARNEEDPLHIGRILTTLGTSIYFQGDYERSNLLFTEALHLFIELDVKHDIGMVYCNLGNVAWAQGHYAQAREYYGYYLETAESTGDPLNVSLALRNLSLVSQNIGDWDSAMLYAERCVALTRAVGDQTQLAAGLMLLGGLATENGRLLEAREYFLQGLAASRRINNRSQEAGALNELGYVAYMLDELPAAMEHLDLALTLSETIGDRWQNAVTLLQQIWVFRKMGDHNRVVQKLREGLHMVSTLKSDFFHTWYLLEAAKLWYERGQNDYAAAWTGLLSAKAPQLDVKQQAILDDLQRELETQLGTDCLNAAIEHGKTLDIEDELQNILIALN